MAIIRVYLMMAVIDGIRMLLTMVHEEGIGSIRSAFAEGAGVNPSTVSRALLVPITILWTAAAGMSWPFSLLGAVFENE